MVGTLSPGPGLQLGEEEEEEEEEKEEEAEEEEEMKEAGSLSAFFTIAADCTTALQKYVTFGDKAYIQLRLRHTFNYEMVVVSNPHFTQMAHSH